MKRKDFLKAIPVITMATTVKGKPIGDFTCTRCGLCCTRNAPPDYWLKSDINVAQQERAVEERAKYPTAKAGCEMNYFENGLATCIIAKLFGQGKRPIQCQKFPYEYPENHCYQYMKFEIEKFFIDKINDILMIKLRDGTISPICKIQRSEI